MSFGGHTLSRAMPYVAPGLALLNAASFPELPAGVRLSVVPLPCWHLALSVLSILTVLVRT